MEGGGQKEEEEEEKKVKQVKTVIPNTCMSKPRGWRFHTAPTHHPKLSPSVTPITPQWLKATTEGSLPDMLNLPPDEVLGKAA